MVVRDLPHGVGPKGGWESPSPSRRRKGSRDPWVVAPLRYDAASSSPATIRVPCSEYRSTPWMRAVSAPLIMPAKPSCT
jgi:hypothetical protein